MRRQGANAAEGHGASATRTVLGTRGRLMSDLSQRLTTALAGRYRIERELGRGGMATVYLAEDLRHHRRVAIKVLDPEVAAAIGSERFLREIETVAQLTHPHILPLHDSGEADRLLYYVMPYVEGESLRQRLSREKQLPVDEAVRIAREVADALDHAHRAGIVHRDVKPENVLLEAGHAVVADFGIARAVAAGSGSRTTSGVTLGTPMYMSPEQGAGSRDLDGRSDLYSLGCVVYEMLAGQPPFMGPTAVSLAHQHLNVAPRPVTELRPAVPAGMARAIGRALAKTPADRYATAGAFAVALAQDTGTVMPLPPPRARRALRVAATAVLALVAYVFVAAWQAWWPFGGREAPPAKKDWILVAEFDGPAGDSTLAPAARSLLSAALDQSRMVATVSQDQIRQALAAAGKPRSVRVDAELARELAYRSAVRAVLEGSIGRLGKGYAIVLKVVDADTARVILTRSGTARNDDGLIPALGEMAKELRRGLGENRRALAATRPMALVATPSFEAYRIYVQAMQRYRAQTGMRDQIRGCRAALALDPDFASARLAMAYSYINLGYPDSARACIEEALRHPERLTRGARERAEIERASMDGDYVAAVAAYDRILADDPGNITALANSNDDLSRLGRFEVALARTRKAMALSPFGPSGVMRLNETRNLEWLGRFDEARESNRRQTGYWKVWLGAEIELAAGRFAVAESAATANLDDPGISQDFPEGMQFHLAFARFGRGAVAASVAAADRCVERARAAHDPAGEDWDLRSWLELSLVSDGAFRLPRAADPSDTSASALLRRGLAAGVNRDAPLASRCLRALRAYPRLPMAGDRGAMAVLEARLAALTGRPEDAVRLLRPVRASFPDMPPSLAWIAWWQADAFEQLGQPDSAALILESVPSVPFNFLAAVDGPYLHRRLALLYAKLGRVADAERHLAAAERAWDRPDPAVRRMLDEARAAVRAARGLARPAT